MFARKISPARLLTYIKQVTAAGFIGFALWITFRHTAGKTGSGSYLGVGIYSSGPVSRGQELIDYLGNHLTVTYKSLDNRNGFLAEISITNDGNRDVIGSDWTIYLNHFQYVDTDKFNFYNGHPDTEQEQMHQQQNQRVMPQLLIQHMMGNLYMLQPTTHFGNLTAGQKLVFYLTGGAPMSARAYLMPNWYVTGSESSPSILRSTSDDALEYVANFDQSPQWMTSKDDMYTPYSPPRRFVHNQVKDLGVAQHKVLPTPLKITQSSEDFISVDLKQWTIVHTEKTMQEAQYIQSLFGGKISTSPPSSEFISLSTGFISVPRTGPLVLEEAYTLTVSQDTKSVTIIGTTEHGVFNGIMSLLSLIDSKSRVPIVEIADAPRLAYRGIMVDVVRNFHGMKTLKKMIDGLAMFKMNVLHIHMADDEGWRLQIPGLEELTEVGSLRCHDTTERSCLLPALGSGPFTNSSGSGHFTVEEYIQLLKYAKQRHVEIIPEFDMPGHSHAAIKSMEARYHKYRKEGRFREAEMYLLSDLKDSSNYLSGQFFRNNAINPCIESSFKFVEHVMAEVMAMHKDVMPLKRFHFGGDEVPQDAFVESPSCSELMKKNEHLQSSKALKSHFVQRVAKIAAKQGIGLQGWEDGFENVNNQPYSLAGLGVKEAVTHSWYNIWEGGLAHRTHEFANAGYKVVLSHVTHLYFDAPQEPDPEERGLYWATRYIDMKRTFYYMPESLFDNVDFGYYGQRLNKDMACSQFINCMKLTNPENVIGIQAQAWSETMRTEVHLSEMLFPRVLALAERAWHRADWEIKEESVRRQERRDDWQNFANTLGHKELARLDQLEIPYYIPPPGARLEGETLQVNSALPGLEVQMSQEGTFWTECTDTCHIKPQPGKTIYLSTRSADKKRQSRSIKFTFP